MRIIGIDPALRITGFGIIDNDSGGLSLVKAGIITTSSDKALPEGFWYHSEAHLNHYSSFENDRRICRLV